MGELRAAAARDESPIPWAGAALERSPVFGRAHLVLARAMFARPGQARLEYKLAYAQDPGLAPYVVQEVTPLVRSFEDAMELVADGPSGIAILTQLSSALVQDLPSTAVRLDEEVQKRDPNEVAPLQHALSADLHDLREPEPWCVDERKRCLHDAEERADRLVGLRPNLCDAWELRSNIVFVAGDTKRAYEDLAAAVDKADDRRGCAEALVRFSMATGMAPYFEQAVDRLAKIGCATDDECLRTMAFLADAERSAHNTRKAIFYYKRAADLKPTEVAYLVAIAQLAEQDNMHGEAALAYGKLATAQPQEALWVQKKEEHERAVRDTALRNLTAPSP
jgi:hypothetical protein